MERKNLLRCVAVVLLVVGGMQCGRGKPLEPEGGASGSMAVEVVVETPTHSNGAAAKVPVTKGYLRLSGPSMATLQDTLVRAADGHMRATIAGIPVGIIKVELYLMSAQDDTLWRASKEGVNIEANKQTPVLLQALRVNDRIPKVDFEATSQLERINRPFSFRALVSDVHDADDSLEVQWDFEGDGKYDTPWSKSKDTQHRYPEVGEYRVVVQVRDRSSTPNNNTNINDLSLPPKKVRVIDLIAQAGLKGADSLSAVMVSRTEPLARPLNGKLSQGMPGQLSDSLIFHWRHLLNYPEAIQVSVENTFNINKSRDAGEIRFAASEGVGLYAFALTVEYEGIFSDPDTLLMQVHSRPPEASVDPPAEIRVGQSVGLVGKGSDPDGGPLNYRWRGAQVGLLSDSTSQSPTFTPDQAGTYVFELVVVDTDPQESPAKRVEIQVRPKNQAPVANAGPDASGFAGQDLSLDGSKSSDPDPGDQLNLTYRWASLNGLVLGDPASPRPVFRVSDPDTYRFVLVVNDGFEDSLPDTVVVAVELQNRAPVANAGPDVVAQVGEEVSLSGEESSDPDGDLPLLYQWRSLDGGVVGDETQAQARFSAETPGEYLIELVVGDRSLESTPDTVRVRLKDLPRLVFAAVEPEAGDLEIYSARMDGSDRFRLTASPGEDLHPKTSPDGQTIVFASNRKGSVDIRTNETVYDIWRVNAEGADPTLMVETADWPALASDGRLAYSRNTGLNQDDPTDPIADIFVLELDGFESGPFSNSEDLSKNTQPSWSPEGRRLVYAKGHAQFGWDLFVVNLDGGETTQITTEVDSQEDEPAWSPDGTQIAFVSDRDGGDRNIFVVDPGGGDPTPLTGEAGVNHYSPSWSPDGSMIAYVRLDFSGKSDIYIMNADGSDPHLAIENAQDPAWLPGR